MNLGPEWQGDSPPPPCWCCSAPKENPVTGAHQYPCECGTKIFDQCRDCEKCRVHCRCEKWTPRFKRMERGDI
jgi:hypothetical protein